MSERRRTVDEQITVLLDIDEAARVLSVHPATLYRWARARRVPSIRIGACVLRFDPAALRRFLDAHSAGPRPQC